MPTSEQKAMSRALQTAGDIHDLRDLGLKAEDLQGLRVVNIGAGKYSSLRADLQSRHIEVELKEFDGNPCPHSGIKPAMFSHIPVESGSTDLVISRNACPMYLPEDNPELAAQVIGEIRRILKPGGEARLTPWQVSSAREVPKSVIPDPVLEKNNAAPFSAMRAVAGLSFQLIQEGDVDPRSGEVRHRFDEVMIIRKNQF